jgi:glycosyltransferase involved in cell wall biosynthesis
VRKIKKYKGRVLFVGQCYYNTWYLSRALRKLGWKADVLNIDNNPDSQKFYHGEDYKYAYKTKYGLFFKQIWFYLTSLFKYDIFHFSNMHGMMFGFELQELVKRLGFPAYSEIRLLKNLGKKIVYSNNGCMDGVAQSSFRTWGTEPICDICIWRNRPDVCSDERNLAWGKVRNELADYQCNLGGNKKDYNDDPRVHEVPGFYCLDIDFWRPDLPIPEKYRVDKSGGKVLIYHAVGNFQSRTDEKTQKNEDIPNKEVRYLQVQSDIVVDMLTFGFYGANIREAMMLGKPSVCFLRPEWLDNMRKEIPEYVEEIPVVSATPDTIYDVLVDLITHPEKREEIGRKSREFAVKWHSKEAGAKRMDVVYSDLLAGRNPHLSKHS